MRKKIVSLLAIGVVFCSVAFVIGIPNANAECYQGTKVCVGSCTLGICVAAPISLYAKGACPDQNGWDNWLGNCGGCWHEGLPKGPCGQPLCASSC